MTRRIRDINPTCRVEAYPIFYKPAADNAEGSGLSIINGCDFVADAIDMVSSKIGLAESCREKDIPIISAMGCGNKLDPTLLQVTDISKTYGCPLARVMRKELRTRGIHHLKVVFSPEKPVSPAQPEAPPPGRRSVPASNPWVPATAGLLLGSAVVRDLIAQVSLP